MESLNVTIEMNTTELYVSVVQFSTLYRVVRILSLLG